MTFRIGGLRAEKGRFVHGRLDVDGVPIPLLVGAGKQDGPTLLIVSAQHRTEFRGPGVVHRLLTGLDLDRVRGTVVILPLTSILQIAWQRDELGLYRDRFDDEARKTISGVNMNRVWPGRADGNFVERAAHAIYEDLCRQADAALDFHCCRFADGRFTAAAETHPPSFQLARAFGFPVIDLVTPESYAPGLLHIEGALDLGVPMILVETYPGHSTVMEETVAACERGGDEYAGPPGNDGGRPGPPACADGLPAGRPGGGIHRRGGRVPGHVRGAGCSGERGRPPVRRPRPGDLRGGPGGPRAA